MARRILFTVALGLAAGFGAVNYLLWSHIAAAEAAIAAAEAQPSAYSGLRFDIDDWNDS
jgi:hypothetical protein